MCYDTGCQVKCYQVLCYQVTIPEGQCECTYEFTSQIARVRGSKPVTWLYCNTRCC
uniref:Uncharacterized protein n=1 Tax=Oncorhynchus tshawytscha TaxID=74940 RepID=A0AAZ3SII0_ONCTS